MAVVMAVAAALVAAEETRNSGGGGGGGGGGDALGGSGASNALIARLWGGLFSHPTPHTTRRSVAASHTSPPKPRYH